MTKERKFHSLELKDFDDKSGVVAFYFAAWSKDLDNDIILKTAYTKTFSSGLKDVYHNRDHKDACGVPDRKSFGVDDSGAFAVSKLAIKTFVGNDTYEQYKAGVIKGHSQEFETILSDYDTNKQARIIKEVRLWGVTSVTNIPANLDTPTISLKSYQDVVEQLKRINDLLHKGHISDACGEHFTAEFARLESWVTKNKAMANAGLLHCDSCKSMFTPDDFDGWDSESEENDIDFKSCPKCGKFINKTGVQKSYSLITAEFISRVRVG